MTAPLYGETVDVTIRGAKVISIGASKKPTLLLALQEEGHDVIAVPLESLTVTVKRVTPADGVPQVGDLWRDAEGALYFAATRGDAKAIYFFSAEEHKYGNDSLDWAALHAGPYGPIQLEFRPKWLQYESDPALVAAAVLQPDHPSLPEEGS